MATKKKSDAEAIVQEAAEDQKEVVQTDPEENQEELSVIAKRYQGFYKKGFWTKKMLKNMVGKKITEKECEIITGEKYE